MGSCLVARRLTSEKRTAILPSAFQRTTSYAKPRALAGGAV